MSRFDLAAAALRTVRPPTLLALLVVAALGTPPASRAEENAPASRPTVLVELFTSQGCSSCPPADRLLAELAREGEQDGIVVVPIAFHVDYWNYIGWRDPFSSAEWSARQRRYAGAFDLGTIYTPQLFLNGRAQVVGSDEREVRRQIRRTAVTPAAELTLAIDPDAPDAGKLSVTIGARPSASEPGRRVTALLALIQDGLVTPVSRGENAHKTLRDERVVRSLTTAFELDGDTPVERRLEIPVDPSWPRDDLAVVLFLQDSESMQVLGARSIPVGGP